MGKTKDQYFTALNEYKQKYKTEKVILLMQVGDFYEVYGLKSRNYGRQKVNLIFMNLER